MSLSKLLTLGKVPVGLCCVLLVCVWLSVCSEACCSATQHILEQLESGAEGMKGFPTGS